MVSRAFWSAAVVCAVLPAEGRAQVAAGDGPLYGPRVGPAWGPGDPLGALPTTPLSYRGFAGYGYPGPYAPVPPAGRLSAYVYPTPFYNGTPGSFGSLAYSPIGYGPYGYGYGRFGYGAFGGFGYPGFYGYSGRSGSTWSNGLSLYGAPVPVPGSVPGVFGNNDLVQQWRSTLAPGYGGPLVVGISVSSRPRYPLGSVRPVLEPVVGAPVAPVPAAKVGGALILSVKVPQPAAEVLVDGRPTLSTGTDRTFETPALASGGSGTYTLTARWVERGRVVEVSKVVTGAPGEVVRVDFTK